MITYQQLYDPYTSSFYSIDKKSLVFKVTSDEVTFETRVKPYYCALLLALFTNHPNPVSYENIFKILQENRLSCPDETRLHRKISELRSYLKNKHPSFKDLISNVRGIGYSLPLHFKDPHIDTQPTIKIKNETLVKITTHIQEYIETSLFLSSKCNIIQSEDGFILDRKSISSEIESLLKQFTTQQKKLFSELNHHPENFYMIRLELILAKLKTYLGIARISEFSVSKKQWLEWHKLESRQIFNDLIELIKKEN